jgi:hypothetical protein
MQDQGRSWERRSRRMVVPSRWTEFAEIIRGAVGEGLVRLSPHVLRRVEFWRVCREVVDLQPRVAPEKCLDLPAAVDGSAIPEEIHRAAQMPEQVKQERPHVKASERAGPTPEIECHPTPLGRHRQPAADREAVVAVPMTQVRRPPSRHPRAAHGGDEQKAALIDEDEMGATSSGVFLSGASRPGSTGRWPPRPAPPRAVPASGIQPSPVRSFHTCAG